MTEVISHTDFWLYVAPWAVAVGLMLGWWLGPDDDDTAGDMQ